MNKNKPIQRRCWEVADLALQELLAELVTARKEVNITRINEIYEQFDKWLEYRFAAGPNDMHKGEMGEMSIA